LFIPMTVVALLFTLLWLLIQTRHWQYCVHVNERIKAVVPEYHDTLVGYASRRHPDGLSISRPLALAVPSLFAFTWIFFIIWLLFRQEREILPEGLLSIDRLVLLGLTGTMAWLVYRLRRMERKLRKK